VNARLIAKLKLHKRPTPVESPVMAVVELVGVLVVLAIYGLGIGLVLFPVAGGAP